MTPLANTLLGLSRTGFHSIHYTEWGDRANPRVAICVHGLTRQGRDFDFLAQRLVTDGYRVLCPDVVGRGRSGWLAGNTDDYGYPQYLADMTALIARAGVSHVDWIGTSMGGLIGMLLAAQPRSPIRRLVINDVGPFIPKAALARIADYLGRPITFTSLDQLEQELRSIAAPFGPLSDAQWRHLALHSARRLDGGGYGFNYDPGIKDAFQQQLDDVDLWPLWDRVACPTLLLRGEQSDILRRQDALAMTERGPKARLIEFAGVGHAPALMSDDQIAAVSGWLRA